MIQPVPVYVTAKAPGQVWTTAAGDGESWRTSASRLGVSGHCHIRKGRTMTAAYGIV